MNKIENDKIAVVCIMVYKISIISTEISYIFKIKKYCFCLCLLKRVDCCNLPCGDDNESTLSEVVLPWHGYQLPSDTNLTVTGLIDELRLQGDLKTMAYLLTFAARNFSDVSTTESYL